VAQKDAVLSNHEHIMRGGKILVRRIGLGVSALHPRKEAERCRRRDQAIPEKRSAATFTDAHLVHGGPLFDRYGVRASFDPGALARTGSPPDGSNRSAELALP
jgi:hypothetical protein